VFLFENADRFYRINVVSIFHLVYPSIGYVCAKMIFALVRVGFIEE